MSFLWSIYIPWLDKRKLAFPGWDQHLGLGKQRLEWHQDLRCLKIKDVKLGSRLPPLLTAIFEVTSSWPSINTDALCTLGLSLSSVLQLWACLLINSATMKIFCFLWLMLCLQIFQVNPGKYQDLLNPWSGLGTWGLQTGDKCVLGLKNNQQKSIPRVNSWQSTVIRVSICAVGIRTMSLARMKN